LAAPSSSVGRKRAAIVVTTIFEPRFLDGYLDNLESHGRKDTTDLVVIIDRKTPASVWQACQAAAMRGFRVHCPTLEEQAQFLKQFPTMADRIPHDSDNRRNIGFLMALDGGTDFLISIDDDNYCREGFDFVGEHAVVGDRVSMVPTRSTDGWFNIGTLLTTTSGVEIYPRGFPYFARQARSASTGSSRTARVAMNAGLWMSDPDVDAISRIAIAPRVTGVSVNPVFLDGPTWSPINSQNTAVVRDAVAAYYYVRMGFPVAGLSIDRYGDILSGYFCQKCVKARGEGIRIGSPTADHRRTPHNLFKDLYHELAGIVLLEELLPWLTSLKLSGSTYAELYAELADLLEAGASAYRGFVWDDGGRNFLRQTAANMRAWLHAVRTIG
jgi:reversibly glycosylated polypeptide